MPFNVLRHLEPEDYCVIYYSYVDSTSWCPVFWSEKEIEAEAAAARLNELERSIENKLYRVLGAWTMGGKPGALGFP